MNKWHAEEVGRGIKHEYGVDVYLASDVDRIVQAATQLLRDCRGIMQTEGFDDEVKRIDALLAEVG